MRCAQCGTETQAGTSFIIYVGTRAEASEEQTFLCYACQITARYRVFRRVALICGAMLLLAPALVALVLFPSIIPGWSALIAFLLSVPIVGIIGVVGSMVGLGALTKVAIGAIGDFVLIAWTWREPYALSGDDPALDSTAAGERFAIFVRRAKAKQRGAQAYYTRKAFRELGQSAQFVRIAAAVIGPVGLCVLGLLTLACIEVAGLLVDRIH